MRRAVGAVVVMVVIGAWNLAGGWLVGRAVRHDVPAIAVSDSFPHAPAPAPAVTPGKLRRVPREPPFSFTRDPLAFLSTAPPESLDLIPGIGPVLAARIVEARDARGAFTSWDDVLAVRGIGPRTIERWKTAPAGQ